MTTSYRQTDTAAGLGAVQSCATEGLSSTPVARSASIDGTAGTGTPQVTINRASNTPVSGVMFQLASPGFLSWPSGNWTIRLNVTTANSNLTWSKVYVCRRTAAGLAIAMIASNTAVGISLSTTGVKSVTVSGSANSGGSATDIVYIVLGFTNSLGSSVNFNFRPDQLIDTPLDNTGTVSETSAAASDAVTGEETVTGDVLESAAAASESSDVTFPNSGTVSEYSPPATESTAGTATNTGTIQEVVAASSETSSGTVSDTGTISEIAAAAVEGVSGSLKMLATVVETVSAAVDQVSVTVSDLGYVIEVVAPASEAVSSLGQNRVQAQETVAAAIEAIQVALKTFGTASETAAAAQEDVTAFSSTGIDVGASPIRVPRLVSSLTIIRRLLKKTYRT